MKKSILFAAMLLIAAGCTKEKVQVSNENQIIDNDGTPVPVLFGLGQQKFDVAVKSVGSLESWSTTNDLYVFGYNSKAEEYEENATLAGSSEKTTLIYNIKANPTTTGAEAALNVINPATSEPFYYSGNNTYDFYGYYVDDAAADITDASAWELETETGPAPLVITTESAATPVSGVTLSKGVYIPFIINGSQDIMAAEADKSIDEATETTTDEVDAADCYSAYAARRGVQPNLQFKHMLSRFTFEIKPGSDESKNVEVTGIKIMANSKGFLGVVGADKGTVKPLPVDDSNQLAEFSLMELSAGTCVPLNPVSLTDLTVGDDEEGAKAGESIMVMPGETSYDIVVSTKMNESSGIKSEIADLNKKLALAENAQFEAGKSYNVVITVYSLEKIDIKATLNEWVPGEDINIGQDSDQKPSTLE